MGAQPILERAEVENEARDDDARAIDFGRFDHALALGCAQVFDQRFDGADDIRVVEEMHHDDGARRGHRVE